MQTGKRSLGKLVTAQALSNSAHNIGKYVFWTNISACIIACAL